MNTRIEEIVKIWPSVQNVFSVPHAEDEYDRLLDLLDVVVDEVGEDESHPLASLMETLGSLVATYEAGHVPEPESNPAQILKNLMLDHGLKQTDLPEIGSQGVVSEILSGKRALNLRQVKSLSQRFHVSPAAFL